MDKEICIISIGDGVIDNDYTFYENGKVKRSYDDNIYRHSLVQWLEIYNIDENTRKKLLLKCPKNLLPQIQSLFENVT
jgi:hypothetical protein